MIECHQGQALAQLTRVGVPTRVFLFLILIEECAYRAGGALGHAAVVALAAAALAGKHGTGALGILRELEVLVDGEGTGHGTDIEVGGADEREGPVVLLQPLDAAANHRQRPLLAAVLVAVGDDGDEHVVAIGNMGRHMRHTPSDGVVQGRAGTGIVGLPSHVAGLVGRGVVVVKRGVVAVEGEERDILHLAGILLLQHAHRLQGFVHAREGLLADALHGSALVYDNQVVDALCCYFFLCHNLWVMGY